MLIGLLACTQGETDIDACPPGSHAEVLRGESSLLGPDALGGPGDVWLANTEAAFVISAPTAPAGPADPKTYYSYGGIPIDAVARDGCEQAVPERFGEMGFVIGQLDLGDFTASQLRMFRGDSVEVVADGSDGGPAIVDVHGTDDRFWLIELELIRRTLAAGGRKTLIDPWGLDVTVRYTLPPDSPVLTADVQITDDQPGEYLIGTVVFPSDRGDEIVGRTGALSFGGIGLDSGVPWFVSAAFDGDGATAIAMPGAAASKTTIAGVTAILDARQAVTPLKVGPGVSATQRFAVSAGAGDANAATAPLCSVLPEPIPGVACQPVRQTGVVVDAAGRPVADAWVDVQVSDGGGWRAYDRGRTNASGEFSLDLVPLGDVRLQARRVGRDPGAPVAWSPASAGPISLLIGDEGALAVSVLEGASGVPARLTLTRGDERRILDVPPGETTWPLPPGTWDVVVSRGYEYEPVEAVVDVPAGGVGRLDAVIERVVDTTGWMSFDGHVHTEASPDSRVLYDERARNAGGVGLEVIVDSDHEVIADMSPGVEEAGLGAFVAVVPGSEVTAASPEHTQAWPIVPDGTPRGGPVRWYGKSLAQIFAAERDRGADVVVLNHPRIGCNFLCLIGWDRLTGEATLDDPAVVGLPTDQPLFDWGFDAVEVMNGPRDILFHADRPDRSGFLDDWLAFLNLGHRVTGLGTSDAHDAAGLAWPRTYFAAPTDDPAAFDEVMLVDAVRSGRAVISAGAFARVTANGAGIGELASGPDVALAVRVEAIPAIDVDRVVVLANCDQVAALPASDPNGVVKLDTTLPLRFDHDTHLVVMAFGADPMPAGLPDYDPTGVPRVITNAVYVDADGDGRFTPPGGKACVY
jgi:hypothetical protein